MSHVTRLACVVTAVVAIAAADGVPANGAAEALVLTHGVASGDVTSSSAVVWARASGPAQMHVELSTDAGFEGVKSTRSASATAASDFTAQLVLRGLDPDTRYWYRVWFAGAGARGRSEVNGSAVGTFRTAPAASESRPITFIVGADVGGQRFCRNAALGGYTIFAAMSALAPDFFIANGDMIYADGDCPAEGPDGPGGWENIPGDFPGIGDAVVDWTNTAQVRDVYLRHYRSGGESDVTLCGRRTLQLQLRANPAAAGRQGASARGREGQWRSVAAGFAARSDPGVIDEDA